MQLNNDKVTLRYIKKDDIENYIKWQTIDTEWKKWDAPWANKENDDRFLMKQKEAVKKTPQEYRKFEIENEQGEHMGWVSSYYIEGDKDKLAVGIVIPPTDARNKGYGFAALTLFMKHLFELRKMLYIQTWSGNFPMIALAAKLRFIETQRDKDLCLVFGKTYDGLTFAITRDEFCKLHKF